MQVIPVTSLPNQTFQMILDVDGKNITLGFKFSYSEAADYWVMTVYDPGNNMCLLDSIPLLSGQYPAANILEQYAYLGIGSAVLVPTAQIDAEGPDDTTLGTEFVLLWGDTL